MGVVEEAIMSAINQGAPAFNRGRPDVCRDVYIQTARGILEAGMASTSVNLALSDAIVKAESTPGASDAAWVMRHVFDDVLDGRIEAMARLQEMPAGAQELTMLDFSSSLGGPRWFSMDDSVMGGMSSSSMVWDPKDRSAAFQGNLTTANNGGFASIRSESWGGFALLGRAKGIRLTVKGDGRTYKLSAKSDDGYDGVMYQHDFPTSDRGEWETVDLAFVNFKPNFRGRLVPGRPPISGAQVRQLGLMVSKFSDMGGLTSNFRTGAFKLGIRSINPFL